MVEFIYLYFGERQKMANTSVFKKIDKILERINETIDDADVETIEPLEKIRNQ